MRLGVQIVLQKGNCMKFTQFIVSLAIVMGIAFSARAQTPAPSGVPMCIDPTVIAAVVYVPCPSYPPYPSYPPVTTPVPSATPLVVPTPTPNPCTPIEIKDEPTVLDEKLVYKNAIVLPSECVPTPTPVVTPTPVATPTTNEEVVPTPTPVATPVTQVTTPTNAIEGASCSLQMAGAGMLPMQANGYLMLIVTWLFGNLIFKRDK